MNEADKCVYYHFGGGQGVIMCLYVDDILIFGTNLYVIEEVKNFLSQSFEMKDMGVADVILNIKLLRDGNGGVTLVQSHYVKKIWVALDIVTANLLSRLTILVWCCERIEESQEINWDILKSLAR